jgi:cyclohexanone monooxygenase
VPSELTAERKQDYAGIVDRTKNSAFGMPFTFHPKPMAECTDEEIDEVLWKWWNLGGLGFMLSSWVEPLIEEEKNLRVGKFLADRIAEKVHDPAVADLLTPKGVQYGIKRIPLDSGYFETFNEPHVHLIDVKSNPIAELTPAGIKLADGTEYELDVIVYATGFDSTTGTLNRIDIRGRGGRKLKDKWAEGPRTYLGMSAVGFPNLLMCTGPQSPNVLSNMPVSIEEHVNFFAGIIAHMTERGAHLIEPTLEAEDAWVDHNNEVINATLFPRGDTTYMGANIPGKPRVFVSNLDMVVGYAAKLAEVAANGYEGFVLEGQPATV